MTVAEAYSAGAEAWASGPMRVYGPLAAELVGRSPEPLTGRRVLDLGAGTGAASRALPRSRVVAVDLALGMLAADRETRPPAVVCDALALPFPDDSFDAAIAAFSLNHLDSPALGLREAGRVTRGPVLASTVAADDDHPVRPAVEQALAEQGWAPPSWYVAIKRAASGLSTVRLAIDALSAAGLRAESVEQVAVPFPHLDATELVRWRLGMAACAGYADAPGVEQRALELLGGHCPMLVRQVIFIVARGR